MRQPGRQRSRGRRGGATGIDDPAVVVTEPYSEWVLSGEFSGGAPAWQDAGAVVTEDVGPYQSRKLVLLNGAHSLLAYAAPLRGHETVAEAVEDEVCRQWLEDWWAEGSAHLPLPADELARYRADLLVRFANPAIQHRLEQIAADGSQKLPVRILPTLRLERAAGRMPDGAVCALAAWMCHLRGFGAAVSDPAAAELVELAGGPLRDSARRVLQSVDRDLADDIDLVRAVAERARALSSS